MLTYRALWWLQAEEKGSGGACAYDLMAAALAIESEVQEMSCGRQLGSKRVLPVCSVERRCEGLYRYAQGLVVRWEALDRFCEYENNPTLLCQYW